MSNSEAPNQSKNGMEVGQEQPVSFADTARGTAVKLLMRHEASDSYIDKILDGELRRSDLSPADRALVTELVNGTIRWLSRLDWVLTGFYHGEFTKCMPLVKNSMRIALYQMLFLSKIPPPAAINESVELVKRFKGEKHAGVVNGVLRNILRNIGGIRYPDKEENVVLNLAVHSAHPQWMVKRYVDRFGVEETEQLLNANNQRPHITLRVNSLHASVEQVEAELDEAEIKHERSPVHDNSILITSLRDVRSLPLFTDGHVTVQDASASLAVRLANPQPGMLVYDLCAAPGGKAVFTAELMQNKGRIVALEIYESKLTLIADNAKRAGVTIVEPTHGDARNFKPDALANLVLVDAPCTGMGTLSKKPDIKWRRAIDDIRKMALRQKEILSQAATLVAEGGALVYSTCTIEPEENQQVVAWFLEQHPNFELERADTLLQPLVCHDGFMQTLPHKHQADGAFAARLVRMR